MIDAETARIVRGFRSAGVDPLLLKGPSTSRWLYEEPADRPYSDIDLLVSRSSLSDSVIVLRSLGFADRLDDPIERGPDGRTFDPTENRYGAGIDPSVDLHCSFHGIAAPPENFWSVVTEDTDRINIAGEEVSVASVRVRAMLLALHVGAHDQRSPHPREDLVRVVERLSDDEWREVDQLATRLNARSGFIVGLETIPAGRRLIDRLHLDVAVSDVTAVLKSRGHFGPAVALERLRSTEGWRSRMKLLLRKVVPTRQLMRRKYPRLTEATGGVFIAYAVRLLRLGVYFPRAVKSVAAVRREVARAD